MRTFVILALAFAGIALAAEAGTLARFEGDGDGDLYDSIMLDGGTHCTFAQVIPTVFD